MCCCCCCCPPAISALFYLWVRSGFSKGSVAGALTFFPPDPPHYKFQRVGKDGKALPDDNDNDDDIANDDDAAAGMRTNNGHDDDDDDSDLGTFEIKAARTKKQRQQQQRAEGRRMEHITHLCAQ